jgi:hypothetical protein
LLRRGFLLLDSVGLSFSLALEFGGFQHAYPPLLLTACIGWNWGISTFSFFRARSADWAVALHGGED